VIVLDDVITTGATIEEARRVLRSLGVAGQNILFIAIAHNLKLCAIERGRDICVLLRKARRDPSGFFDCCAGGDDIIEDNHKPITHCVFIFDGKRILKIFSIEQIFLCRLGRLYFCFLPKYFYKVQNFCRHLIFGVPRQWFRTDSILARDDVWRKWEWEKNRPPVRRGRAAHNFFFRSFSTSSSYKSSAIIFAMRRLPRNFISQTALRRVGNCIQKVSKALELLFQSGAVPRLWQISDGLISFYCRTFLVVFGYDVRYCVADFCQMLIILWYTLQL